jgi:inhibitor of KinA
VAIGGKQTGIYPEQSAGGWNCIGKTPISFFNVDKAEPCFAKSGDKIKFVSVSKEEFSKIDQEINNESFTLTKTILDA